ncbi:MAG TPA: phage tail protein [Sphingobium sp.]|uniref:phage tail protein n=1 Tax=Sphingobium sp. TaxID=1912891 RepID=UPI002ED5D7AF
MTAIMSFGMFVFSIPTLSYEELQRRSDFRHARTPRIGARDAAQFIGPGEETISLSGSVYTELGDGETSIEELRTIGYAGTALPLVCANGTVYGTFVITGLDERHKAFWPDGSPRKIDFGLDLLRVDETASSTAASAPVGFDATGDLWA